MTVLRTTTSVFGLLLATFSQLCVAQAPSSTTPVAVVDVGYLFKNHARFKQAMDEVKRQVQASEEEFRARGKDIEARAKKLATYKTDSVEFKTLEAETARLQAQIQADMALKRKEFLQKEAEVYYTIYQEIQQHVKAFADSHGISLVLRFTADQIESADRNSVLQGVNRPVVYQRNLNITYDVLDRLQRARSAQRTAQAPARGTTSPAKTRK